MVRILDRRNLMNSRVQLSEPMTMNYKSTLDDVCRRAELKVRSLLEVTAMPALWRHNDMNK